MNIKNKFCSVFMKQLKLKIYGKVQGVFYRESTKQKAEELGLAGYVENLSDGTVKILAEGKEEGLKKLLKWCKIGSQYAEVEKVEEEWKDEVLGFEKFEIEY